MSFVKKGFAIAAIAAMPVLSAPAPAEAATATGSITGNLAGTIDFGASGGWMSITGTINTLKTLNDDNATAPLGWRAEGNGTLLDGNDNPTGAPLALVEVDSTPRSADQLASEYLFNPQTSLFTFGAFLLSTGTQSIMNGAPVSGTDFFGISAAWSLEVTNWVGGPPSTTEGTFSFLFDDPDQKSDVAFLFGNFIGNPSFAFPEEGSYGFEARLTLAPIPVPAALPLLAGGLGLLGLMGWRRRQLQG